MPKNNREDLTVIGPSAMISLGSQDNIPAKIDTGASSSSIWATNIKVTEDGKLNFVLFGKESPFYTGEILSFDDYRVHSFRSAMGEEQIRYRVFMSIKMAGKKIKVLFSLADRSKNSFPVLLGRRTLRGKFIVNVSLPNVEYNRKPTSEVDLEEFERDPAKFHQKYVAQKGEK